MKKPFIYLMFIPIVLKWFRFKYKPIYINKEEIPKKGRVLLAGTHVSKMDALLVASATKRCVRGVGKAELFKNPFSRFLFNGLGAIPVDREKGAASVIPACVRLLEKEELIGIMPEGTINRTDDIIMPFKTGVIRMSLEAKAPIVPFAIIAKVDDNYKSFAKGVKIIFGDAYHPKTKEVEKEIKVLETKVIELLKAGEDKK